MIKARVSSRTVFVSRFALPGRARAPHTDTGRPGPRQSLGPTSAMRRLGWVGCAREWGVCRRRRRNITGAVRPKKIGTTKLTKFTKDTPSSW